jgi:hypothetical protein
VPRALFALLALSLTLSAPPAGDASADRPPGVVGVETGAAATIVLRGRQGGYGPWRRYLWLKLVRSDVISFSVCAVWNRPGPPPPTCRAAPGTRLPRGTVMRLEQRRAGPGWKVVGTSRQPALEAVLSNTVSGNRPGLVAYRVTLRNRAGRVFRTSNTFKVFWHK